MVPKRLVNKFEGREEQLLGILSHFNLTPEESGCRILILQALGGQGKTQIALEYCRRSRSTYRGVFWVNASSEETAIQSFVDIARELDPASSAALKDDNARVQLVVKKLERWDARWLMVFDNYDDPDRFPNVEEFIPSCKRICPPRHGSDC